MRFVLVAEESAGLAASALYENSAGRPRVHRIEVIAILNIGGVGVIRVPRRSPFALRVLRGCSRPARRDAPCRLRSPSFRPGGRDRVQRSKSFPDPGAHFEAVKLAFLAGLAEAQSFREEALAFGHFAHGEHCSIEAAHGFAGADLFGYPALARIVRVFQDFERQSSGVLEADVLLTEPLLNAGVLESCAYRNALSRTAESLWAPNMPWREIWPDPWRPVFWP